MADEMPPDPFLTPETLGMMKGMHDLHSAAVAAGFPENVATDIITGLIARLIIASTVNATPPPA